MSKPRWAPRHAKWGPVKPGFWPIWHANRDTLRDNGYSVRKNDEGQWQSATSLAPIKAGRPSESRNRFLSLSA